MTISYGPGWTKHLEILAARRQAKAEDARQRRRKARPYRIGLPGQGTRGSRGCRPSRGPA